MVDLTPDLPDYVAPPDSGCGYLPLIDDLNGKRFCQCPTLIGLIAAVPAPLCRTKSGGFMRMVVLKDPSCIRQGSRRRDLLLFIFSRSPPVLRVGDDPLLRIGNILCVRSVKLERRNGKLDGRVFSARNLLEFPSSDVGSSEPLSRVGQSPLNALELRRLDWVRRWFDGYAPLHEQLSRAAAAKLSDVHSAGVYNLLVEVVSCSFGDALTQVRVRDGTRCPMPCVGSDDSPRTAAHPLPVEGVLLFVRDAPCREMFQSLDRSCPYARLLHVPVTEVKFDGSPEHVALRFNMTMLHCSLVLPLCLPDDHGILNSVQSAITREVFPWLDATMLSSPSVGGGPDRSPGAPSSNGPDSSSGAPAANGPASSPGAPSIGTPVVAPLTLIRSSGWHVMSLSELPSVEVGGHAVTHCCVRLPEAVDWCSAWTLWCPRCRTSTPLLDGRLVFYSDLCAVRRCPRCRCNSCVRLTLQLLLFDPDQLGAAVPALLSGDEVFRLLGMAEPAVDMLELVVDWIRARLAPLDRGRCCAVTLHRTAADTLHITGTRML